jgi:hypothetical protein
LESADPPGTEPPPLSPTGTCKLLGNAEDVVLRPSGPSGLSDVDGWPCGPTVPVGHYDVYADFGGGMGGPRGTVEIVADKTAEIDCKKMDYLCTPP